MSLYMPVSHSLSVAVILCLGHMLEWNTGSQTLAHPRVSDP